MDKEQTVTISLESLNQVFRYLAARPYAEVAQLVELLKAAKPLALAVVTEDSDLENAIEETEALSKAQ